MVLGPSSINVPTSNVAAPTVATQVVTADSTPVVTQAEIAAGLNCDGPVKGQEASYEWQYGAAVTITEKAKCDADFLLAIYYTPKARNDADFFTTQVLVSLSDIRVGAGETKTLNPASVPACGTFQADVWRGLSVDAVQVAGVNISPADGANVSTYTFGDTGTVCQPPTRHVDPPPPTDPCVLNPEVCAPPPPVDVCINIEGNQATIPLGYERSQDGVCTIVPPPPPPPVACSLTAVYNGSNPFSLANSGDATELAYVRTNVSNLLNGPVKTELTGTTSFVSDGNYPVVLVKAANSYYLYTNVVVGQVLLSQSFNSHDVRQNISHISRFTCSNID